MEEYTLKGIEIAPNSHKSKEKEKVTKIAQGKLKKKPLSKRFSETFIKSDAESVASYIFLDILVPAIVDTFRDIINSSLDMFLYGDARSGRASNGRPTVVNRNRSYVSYRDYYDEPRIKRESNSDFRPPWASNSCDEVIFETREKAKEVRDAMLDLIDEYEEVSVREFKEMAGVDFEFTDEKYGWTNLAGVTVTGSPRKGYVINLPRPRPISVD